MIFDKSSHKGHGEREDHKERGDQGSLYGDLI